MSEKTILFDDHFIEEVMNWIDPGCGCDRNISSLKIPAQFRKFSGVLYCGLSISRSELKEFKNSGKLRAKKLQSWSGDFDAASRFAFDGDGEISLILEHHPAKEEVFLNIGALLSNDEFQSACKLKYPRSWKWIQSLLGIMSNNS